MKFVLAYTMRDGGSATDRHEAAKAAQRLLANWQPSGAATIHEWMSRCDGNGGFSVIETDDGVELLKDLSTWGTYLEFTAYPVVDIGDATPATDAAIAAREGAS